MNTTVYRYLQNIKLSQSIDYKLNSIDYKKETTKITFGLMQLRSHSSWMNRTGDPARHHQKRTLEIYPVRKEKKYQQ